MNLSKKFVDAAFISLIGFQASVGAIGISLEYHYARKLLELPSIERLSTPIFRENEELVYLQPPKREVIEKLSQVRCEYENKKDCWRDVKYGSLCSILLLALSHSLLRK
jgi:hypothetical protein